MGKPKVLIVDAMHASIISMLDQIGIEGHYEPTIHPSDVLNRISMYDGLIIRSKMPLDHDFFMKATSLKFICRAGAGLDLIDTSLATERNIVLLNAPEGNRDAVAEYTLGAILALIRNLTSANDEVKKKIWKREENRGTELMGKTIGILGFGHMGKAVASRLASLHCNVLAYDLNKNVKPEYQVQVVDIGTFLANVEILSIHIPLDERNTGLINKKYLERFKKLEIVINTARGEVLPLDDVVWLLSNGKLKGVVLDVLENEKLNALSPEQQVIFTELVKRQKVLLSPHIAGWTFESYKKINEVLVKKIVEAGLSEYSY